MRCWNTRMSRLQKSLRAGLPHRGIDSVLRGLQGPHQLRSRRHCRPQSPVVPRGQRRRALLPQHLSCCQGGRQHIPHLRTERDTGPRDLLSSGCIVFPHQPSLSSMSEPPPPKRSSRSYLATIFPCIPFPGPHRPPSRWLHTPWFLPNKKK